MEEDYGGEVSPASLRALYVELAQKLKEIADLESICALLVWVTQSPSPQALLFFFASDSY